MRNVNALLEKRASRRAAATTATAATATVASSRARAARAPATHPAPAPGPARGASRRGAAASAHNAAVLAEASAAADLATNAGKAAAARAGTRRNPTLGSWAPPPSTRPERVGACGAQAVSHRDELDAAAAADAEAAAANAAEANLAAVAAAAAAAKEIHEDGDEGADGGADEGAEEWEDVHEYDDEMIAADDAAGDDDDDADAGGSSSKGPARRMTSEERALLLSTHKTHVLCLMARAAAMDAAANDPLVLAVASSAVPRETAFALAGLGEGSNSRAKDALPEIRHVRALAKWFAGNVDVVDGEGFHTRRGERDQSSSRARKRGRKPVAVPLPPRARVRVEGGVIVLDGGDESARDEVDDDEVQIIENPSEATTRPSPTESPSPATDPARAKPEPARELVSDISAAPTERRRRLFAAAVRSAASAAATSLSARLAFAMARRGGTQEEAAALFVAAARGLGCRARTVAALDPTPLRASAATLEAAGVLERHARASKGSKAKTNASMDSKAKAKRARRRRRRRRRYSGRRFSFLRIGRARRHALGGGVVRVGDVRRRAAMGVRGAARGGREGPMEFRDGRGERGRFRRGGGGSFVASPRAVRRGVSPAPERRGFEPDVGRVRCETVSLLAPLACGFVARVGREGRDAQIRRDVFSRSAAQGGTRVVVPRDGGGGGSRTRVGRAVRPRRRRGVRGRGRRHGRPREERTRPDHARRTS